MAAKPTMIPGLRFDRGRLGEVDRSLESEPEVRAAFRSLAESAHFHAVKRGFHPIRQYDVLLDLVREGGRGPDVSEENRP